MQYIIDNCANVQCTEKLTMNIHYVSLQYNKLQHKQDAGIIILSISLISLAYTLSHTAVIFKRRNGITCTAVLNISVQSRVK